MDDKRGIEAEARELYRCVDGTRLADSPQLTGIKEIEKVIDHHKSTFEHTHYYKETRQNTQRTDLTRNIELWNFSLAVFMYAKRLELDKCSLMG